MAVKEIIFPSYSSSQCKKAQGIIFHHVFRPLRSMCIRWKTQANHHVICIANMILQFWRCARRLNCDFSVVSIHGSTMMCFVFRVFLHRRLKKDKAQFICFYCMLQYMAIVSSISHQTLWANNKEMLICELRWMEYPNISLFCNCKVSFLLPCEQYVLTTVWNM